MVAKEDIASMIVKPHLYIACLCKKFKLCIQLELRKLYFKSEVLDISLYPQKYFKLDHWNLIIYYDNVPQPMAILTYVITISLYVLCKGNVSQIGCKEGWHALASQRNHRVHDVV